MQLWIVAIAILASAFWIKRGLNDITEQASKDILLLRQEMFEQHELLVKAIRESVDFGIRDVIEANNATRWEIERICGILNPAIAD